MILEREQWHLGYASLLRDCRGSSSGNTSSSNDANNNIMDIPSVGRALLIVHPDTDAMATARILSYMLRADGVPYQMRPCLGWERLKHVLGKVGVLPTHHLPSKNKDDGDETDNEEDNDANYIANETDIRAVVLMNMGANRNLAKLFRPTNSGNNDMSSSQEDSFGNIMDAVNRHSQSRRNTNNVRCYVFDCHRPYHLANVHAGKNVVLFNDRPFDEEEIPSDGDNLSGDESSSSDESSSDEDSSDGEAEFEGGQRCVCTIFYFHSSPCMSLFVRVILYRMPCFLLTVSATTKNVPNGKKK